MSSSSPSKHCHHRLGPPTSCALISYLFRKSRRRSIALRTLPSVKAPSILPRVGLTDASPATLLIIDTLHPLIHHTLCDPTLSLPDLLTPLLGTRTALLATFHASVPVPVAEGSYQPSPRALLLFIATAIITLSPLSQTIAAAQAAARALPPPPARGLDEGVPGVLVGRGAQAGAVLLDVELRRKSGRAVAARFVMERPDNSVVDEKTGGAEPKFVLLEEHPAYRAAVASEDGGKGKADASAAGDGGWAGSTFELGLTEKQRRDREGVVLPYFDAQKGYAAGEPGEGGRILYQMGQEDMGDFDDEEDEI